MIRYFRRLAALIIVAGLWQLVTASPYISQEGQLFHGVVPDVDGVSTKRPIYFTFTTPSPIGRTVSQENYRDLIPTKQLYKKYELNSGKGFNLKPFEYSFNAVQHPAKTVVVPPQNYLEHIAASVVQAHKLNEADHSLTGHRLVTPEENPALFSRKYIGATFDAAQQSPVLHKDGAPLVIVPPQFRPEWQYMKQEKEPLPTSSPRPHIAIVNLRTPSVVSTVVSQTESDPSALNEVLNASNEYRRLWSNLSRNWYQVEQTDHLKKSIIDAGLHKDMASLWNRFSDAVEPYVGDLAESLKEALRATVRKAQRKASESKDSKFRRLKTSVSRVITGEHKVEDAVDDVKDILFD